MSAFEIYTVYDFLWFFAVYATLGWCAEVAFAAVCDGKFVNRGFLNGPVCPIYGFGVVMVIALLMPLMENKLILFVGSVVLTSALEWITGFVLEKVFHDQWWDYSDTPFNLNGYICLKFSLLWGLACVFIMEIFHPTIVKLVGFVPHLVGWIFLGIFFTLFTVDTVVTARSILKLNKKLEQMEEIAAKLRETSNHLGETISDNMLDLVERSEELKEMQADVKAELLAKRADVQAELLEKSADVKAELQERKEAIAEFRLEKQADWERKQLELTAQVEELRQKYNELVNSKKFVQNRMIKAFPGMKSKYHKEALEELKKLYGLK